MATITKDDLMKLARDTGEAVRLISGGGWWDKALSFIDRINETLRLANDLLSRVADIQNNPALKELFSQKLEKKLMMQGTQKLNYPDPKQMVDNIVNMLKNIVTMSGDMSLSELIEFIEANRQTIEKMIAKNFEQFTSGRIEIKPETKTDSDIRSSGKR